MKIGDSNFYQTLMLAAALVAMADIIEGQISPPISAHTEVLQKEISTINQELGEIKYRIGELESNQIIQENKTVEKTDEVKEHQQKSEEVTKQSFWINPAFAQNAESVSLEKNGSENWFEKYFIAILFGLIAIGSTVMWQIKKKEEKKIVEINGLKVDEKKIIEIIKNFENLDKKESMLEAAEGEAKLFKKMAEHQTRAEFKASPSKYKLEPRTTEWAKAKRVKKMKKHTEPLKTSESLVEPGQLKAIVLTKCVNCKQKTLAKGDYCSYCGKHLHNKE